LPDFIFGLQLNKTTHAKTNWESFLIKNRLYR
jgi:hypothetical protein